jgi:glucose-1-phosphate cytidylyltransferase
MKTFILCGGRGSRLDHEGTITSKAMINIGNEPIIIHLIKSLAMQGLSDFVLCMGYKKESIIKFFTNNKKYKSILLSKSRKIIKIIIKIFGRNIFLTLIDTKLNSGTGWRIKLANNAIKNHDMFLMTYCDGLSNINIKQLLKFHKKKSKLVTVTTVQPRHRYGILKIKKKLVVGFNNNNPKQNIRINGGYFLINPKVLKIIKKNNTYWENEPMKFLIKKRQISSYFHNDFWASLDTNKDKIFFNKIYKKSKSPWFIIK